MKLILLFIILGTSLTFNGYFAQISEREEMQEKFQTYIEDEQLERKFNDYKKVKPKDDKYQKVLKERIKLGFILDDTKQLKRDINSLHSLSLPLEELIGLFKPNRFPPSEWERFYSTVNTLKKEKIEDTTALIFITSLQGHLSLLLLEDKTTLNALQELELIVEDSVFYSSYFLDHYINALIDNEKIDYAMEVLEQSYAKLKSAHILNRLIALYAEEKEFQKIINYSEEIKAENTISLFHLALSYENTKDEKKMYNSFENYARLFQFDDGPFVFIKKGEEMYSVPPENMEKIGDVYYDLEPEAACKYYKLGIVENEPTNYFTLEKFKLAISNDEKLEQLKLKLEKEDQQKAEIQERIKKKLEKCE